MHPGPHAACLWQVAHPCRGICVYTQRYSYVHIQYNTNFKVMATKIRSIVQVGKVSSTERRSNDKIVLPVTRLRPLALPGDASARPTVPSSGIPPIPRLLRPAPPSPHFQTPPPNGSAPALGPPLSRPRPPRSASSPRWPVQNGGRSADAVRPPSTLARCAAGHRVAEDGCS